MLLALPHTPPAPYVITAKLGLATGDYALYLGRLVPEKGVQYLIEAFAGIQTAKRLVIAGKLDFEDAYCRGIMEQAKPESILLGETSTVSHLSQMEYIYDTIIGGYVFPQLSRSTPEECFPQLKLYLDRDEAALPVDYALGLMRYCENHDNAPAIRRYGSGHRMRLATCFLLPGLPLISQDGDVGAGTLIRTLSAIRKRPEFARGKAVYLPTGSSDPAVLTFTRIVPEQFSAVAINFSGQVKQLELQLPPECQDRTLHMREICSDALAICNGKTIRSELPPYATQVFAFAVPQPALPPAPDNKKPADIPTVDPDLVGQIIRTVLDGTIRLMAFRPLVDATGGNGLHKMHMVSPAETVRDASTSIIRKISRCKGLAGPQTKSANTSLRGLGPTAPACEAFTPPGTARRTSGSVWKSLPPPMANNRHWN